MDPFNKLIIQNQNHIKKVLTINKFHQNVLIYHGLKIPQEIYYNYIENENYEIKRSKFKQRIGFIGRFTKEKNLGLLIASMRLLEGLELVVIGGENENGEETVHTSDGVNAYEYGVDFNEVYVAQKVNVK